MKQKSNEFVVVVKCECRVFYVIALKDVYFSGEADEFK